MAKKSEAEYEAELIAAMKARRLQRATDLARQQADLTSQDFPLLPTSDVDALPSLPEEAGDALSPAQRLAVAAFVAGQTCAAAARAAGVSRRTIYNWRKEAAFTRAIDELSSEALEATAIRVRNLMLRSTRVMPTREPLRASHRPVRRRIEFIGQPRAPGGLQGRCHRLVAIAPMLESVLPMGEGKSGMGASEAVPTGASLIRRRRTQR